MKPERSICIRRLSTGSVFRLVAVGIFFSVVPFCLLMGVFAAFGFNAIRWNNEPVLGLKGLLISPFVGVFIGAIFTAVAGAGMAFGLWLYSKLKPMNLRVLEDVAPIP
ncbi:MAG TPA: hypothetical protein VGO53_15290 [Steroidobacteraceae bacterium]|jgi:hypothetical protein|nr:hypothetical protein [Steroidobacteraceae bacterium]